VDLSVAEPSLELVNDGKRLYLRATNALDNVGSWASAQVGEIAGLETLTYSMGGVSVVETKAGSATQTAYVINDHLSSASLVIDADDGSVIANARYLPFGQERWDSVDMPGDRGYTGQRRRTGWG